jgi:hypothetical protein
MSTCQAPRDKALLPALSNVVYWTLVQWFRNRRACRSVRLQHFDFVQRWIRGSSTVVTKKDVDFANGVRFNGQAPVSRRGKATGRGAFEAQSAQAISAAYYFDLAARDYILADSAIELVVERVPCSALVEPSQSSELIFYIQSDRQRGRKHGADSGKLRPNLQEQSRRAMSARVGHGLTLTRHLSGGPWFWNRRVLCDERNAV